MYRKLSPVTDFQILGNVILDTAGTSGMIMETTNVVRKVERLGLSQKSRSGQNRQIRSDEKW